MRKKMWMKSQDSQAMKPEMCNFPNWRRRRRGRRQGQTPFIVIVEIFPRLTVEIAADIAGRGFSLLHGNRRDSGEQLAMAIFERGQVSDDEDFRMAGEAQVRVDQHAAGAMDGSSQRFPQGRGRYPGGPENDDRGQAGRAHDYGRGFDAGDQGRGANFNAQMTQLFFGTAG